MEYEMEELIPLVKELCDRYTGKESTSVTYEAAQRLMEAVLYCIHETTGSAEAAGVSDGSGRREWRTSMAMNWRFKR